MLELAKFKKIHLEIVDSTNVRAMELAASVPFAVITAGEQTAARASKPDKKWFSPRGNLFFTMLVQDPALVGEHLPQLALISAISVVEAVLKFAPSAPLSIKWPNDILLDMKKLCGILIECEGNSAIIGIGVNVAVEPPPHMVIYPVTALAAHRIECTAAELAEVLAERLVENINKGFEDARRRAELYLFKLGKNVVLDVHGKRVEGIFEKLEPNGGIVVNGETFVFGEMTKENF